MAKRTHPQKPHHWIAAGLTRKGMTITRHFTIKVVVGTEPELDADGKPKMDETTGVPVMRQVTRDEPRSERLHTFASISEAKRFMRTGEKHR